MNLSQKKRERMLAFLETLKIQHSDDDSLIAIGEIERELKSKKYGLVWEEHEEAVDVQMQTHIPVFTEDTSREIAENPDSKDYNFLLEGDNLHSLYLLEKTHKGKIDVIYIDPPYNTGNKDFIYDDAFVGTDDSYKHSKWLSFINTRLELAQKLLSKNGVIIISINDNENATLKLICDRIFGEENFIANLIWKSRQNKDNRNISGVSIDHEYLLCYSACPNIRSFVGCERKTDQYKNPDNDPRGPWASANMAGLLDATQRPNCHYDLIHPITKINYGRPKMGWRYDQNTMNRLIAEDRIIFPDNPNGRPRRKVFLNELSDTKTGYSSIVGTDIYTRNGTSDIDSIFKKRIFQYPKPTSLLKEIFSQVLPKNGLILDFFAGSGTTGQAVLELNKQDGGNRHFILCTNNENGICENVTYQRLKTVITGKRADGSTYSEGIPSNLMYYKTDFVEKDSEELSDELLEHIREMIQLEYGVKVDGRQYVMIMDDEEMDNFETHFFEYSDLKAVFVNQDVILSAKQQKMLDSLTYHVIPDHYFDFELREEGELW